MTPKEKAIELVQKFRIHQPVWEVEEDAIQCALIAVDEIINNINQNLINNTILYNRQLMYWLNVKKELEKL